MNLALQSHSPRTRPLNYDALAADTGCQDTTTGNKAYNSLPFSRICIIDHDSSSVIFSGSDRVSYATGPRVTGAARPWATRWAAWVAAAGIRVAKLPFITLPSNGIGSESSLYPATKPTRLSLGFTSAGQMAIAIQKNAFSIEIKWFSPTGEIETANILGTSPALFQNGLVFQSDDPDETDLALYYLRLEVPRTIFARFERDNFGIEYVINSDLQADIRSLIASGKEGLKQSLYGRDLFGRDVTLRSLDYATLIDGDANDLTMSILSGNYRASAVIKELSLDAATLALSVFSGGYGDPIKEPTDSLSGDAATLSVSIIDGEYA